MTRAKTQRVEPDSSAAAELIAQARAHLESARIDGDEVSELELEGAHADAVVAAAAEAVDGA